MPIAHDFEFYKPKTIGEALQHLSKYKSKARLLAGGTDVVVKIKDGQDFPEVVIDLKGIDGFSKLDFYGNELFIGPNVTFSDLIESEIVREKFVILWESAKTVASVGIRNRATVVGNICSAVPSLDSGPALLVYEADVLVKSSSGERKIPITEWFTGPKKTALKEDEIVTGIIVPLPKEKHSGRYEKLARYAGEDLAQAGIGILVLEGNQYRVAFCAVGPVPKRSSAIENLLNGKQITNELIEEIKNIIPKEISPITDIRSTKEYRTHMMKVMFERGMRTAIERLNNGTEKGVR